MSPLPQVIIGNDEPLYNIGVVSRMTGVSMATLRAWERRYDFPESERTSGGHRLYSERDVLKLQWVKGRIDEGMQTAQAINALKHQEESGHVLLAEEPVQEYEPAASMISPPHLHGYYKNLFNALLNKDLETADSILGEALASSNPDDLILDVISPCIAEMGTAWENGKVSIATEHLATNYLRQRLLMWMMSGPPPRTKQPIILTCGPNEWHEGSLLVLGALLRRRRWPVAYLGQSVPLNEIASFAKELAPSMIIMIAMTEETAVELVDWPNWMPETAQSGHPPVGYGGRVFTLQPEWRLRMAGIYLGDNFRDALDTIQATLSK